MKKLSRWARCLFMVLVLSLMSTTMVMAEDTTTTTDQTAGTETSETPQTTTAKDLPAKVKTKIVLTGLQKVKGKYYFYKKGKKYAGKLKNGTYICKKDGITYYLTSKKVVEAYKKGEKYYYPNGKKMTKVQSYDFTTQLTARKIVAKITTDKMTKSQKLLKCFQWVMAKYYAMPRTFRNTPGWPAVYANDHFKNGRGDCHADASAFAYLAKAIGYKNIYVCNDSKGPGHCWCEINGRVYDPLFCQVKSKGGYAKNYGAKYGTYILHPILHIAI